MRYPMLITGYLLLAGCVSAPLVTVAPEPGSSAWWLRTEYWPSGHSVRGIAVRHYDPTWCAADEITPQDFPEEANAGQRGLDNMIRMGGTHFSLSDDFGSGEQLEVFLGAFSTCDGQRGDFLAVLAPGRGRGRARIVQVEKMGRGTGFLYLTPIGTDGFAVVTCFGCDDLGRRYRWNAADGRFDLEPYVAPVAKQATTHVGGASAPTWP